MIAQGLKQIPAKAEEPQTPASVPDVVAGDSEYPLLADLSSLDRLTRELREIKRKFSLYSERLEAWERAQA